MPHMIHALLDTTQVVATHEVDGIAYEVCAEAIATHDRRAHLLSVELRSYLRALDQDHIHEEIIPEWLPEPETITDGVQAEEAHEMADDVFASWCRRVVATVPES
jgi:hypothetical protein